MISRFFTTPVAIHNPSGTTTVDADGVPTTAAATVSAMGHVQPYRAASTEQILGVEEATRARTLWLPIDTVIGHRSTVTHRGDRYEVRGDPDDWRVGSSNDHLEIVIVRQVKAS